MRPAALKGIGKLEAVVKRPLSPVGVSNIDSTGKNS